MDGSLQPPGNKGEDRLFQTVKGKTVNATQCCATSPSKRISGKN